VDELRASTGGGEGSLWEALLERRIVPEDEILQAVSARFRLPVADLGSVDPRVRDEVPEQLARRFNVVPLRATDSSLSVATANPFDIEAEKILAFASGREVRLSLCSPTRIREKLDEVYRPDDLVEKLLGGMADEAEVTQLRDEADDLGASAEEAAARPIIKLVDTLLADGITSRASDVHVEPAEGGVVVRYRIDGVLRQVMKIPRSAGLPLISRIKIMSGMDIADRLRPQDGRCRVAVNGNPVDLRVSTLPASLGEKAVIRILNTRATLLSLTALGFNQEERRAVERLLSSKEGILLVTGPTGSGKTTTLYAALRQVQGEGVNIVTVEDPVEYRLGQNIVQVQVNEKAGLTFASALRSILRQDPDVVLVGEIRDQETAQIAVQASLTGHLVLSTLHTNDAPNSVTRLLDIGMEAYKIGAALRGVVAQRLMRRLCLACRAVATHPLHPKLSSYLPRGTVLYEAVGCSECAQTGYRGRFAVVEILELNQDIEHLVSAGATADLIAAAARKAGMKSLFESGLAHVLSGETSAEELLRVTDPPRGEVEAAGQGPPLPPPRAPRPSPPPRAARHTPAPVPSPAPAPAPSPAAATLDPPDLDDASAAFDLLDEAELPPRVEITQRGSTILLVDDEDQLRRVMRDLLERQGFTVVEARDGGEALASIDRYNPDLVILDLNLPGIDGYTVLDQIRSRDVTRNLPVIVLTAKTDEDNEVRVLELGADDFLTKPFRARALAARLHSMLSRRRIAS
jgi:type II secretory ATPase GspE/PulE/Tfp pilus assembly ATPase PilB-like protein/CheY-like chemotaxis protein